MHPDQRLQLVVGDWLRGLAHLLRDPLALVAGEQLGLLLHGEVVEAEAVQRLVERPRGNRRNVRLADLVRKRGVRLGDGLVMPEHLEEHDGVPLDVRHVGGVEQLRVVEVLDVRPLEEVPDEAEHLRPLRERHYERHPADWPQLLRHPVLGADGVLRGVACGPGDDAHLREDLVVGAGIHRHDEVVDRDRVHDVLERGEVDRADLVGHEDGFNHAVARFAENLKPLDLGQNRGALVGGGGDMVAERLLDLLVGVGGIGARADRLFEAQDRRGEAVGVDGLAGKGRDGDVERVRQRLPVPVEGGSAVLFDGDLPADAGFDLRLELPDRRGDVFGRSRRGNAIAHLRMALHQRRHEAVDPELLHACGTDHRL